MKTKTEIKKEFARMKRYNRFIIRQRKKGYTDRDIFRQLITEVDPTEAKIMLEGEQK